MTLRLFAAVVPSEAVLEHLAALVEPRRDADDNLRWVRRENWHLTLAFFGDVPDGRLDPLQEALGAISGAPLTVTLDGSGAFPNPAAARVLYHAVSTGSDGLTTLSRSIRTAADRATVPSDNAKQVPHLTLARTRRTTDVTRWLRVVESFPAQSFDVTAFTLFQSELRPSGPVYRALHTVPLGPRPRTE